MDDRRTEILGWIAKTQRNQKTLGIVLGVMAMISLGVMAFSRPAGAAGLGIVAIVAVCGFWVLSSHLAEFRVKLDELRSAAQHVADPASRTGLM